MGSREFGGRRVTPKDTAMRRHVIEDFSQDLLIEAGAGTGKTTLLVDRALHAILVRGIPLERIILITFMEKAALEIRLRLTQGLEDRLSGTHHDMAARALAHLAESRITTIHGLCLQLLQQFPREARVPVGFDILDPYDSEQMWEIAFDDWIRTSLNAERVLDAFLAANVSLRQFREMVRTISGWEAMELDPVDMPVKIEDLQDLEETLREWVQIAEREADPDDPARRQISDLSRFMASRAKDPWGWIRTVKSWPLGAPKGNKKGWAHPERLTEQKTWIREELNPKIRAWQAALADGLLTQLVSVVNRDFQPLWHDRKDAANLVNFDDLLRKTRDLVRANPAILDQIREGFDILMVDEFQDTDPIQTEIILTLAQGRAGSLLLVGDPKQAIYRFRGADVELYASVRQTFWERSDALVAPITHNFRSHPAILGAINQYFSKRFPSVPDPERPYIPVFQGLETHQRRDTLARVIVDGGPLTGRADDRRRTVAAQICSLIRRSIAEKWPVYDKNEQATRPIRYSDMVVIMPTRTGLDIFDEVFAAHGIPLAKESGTAFFRRDEIRGYAALLLALQNPHDEVSTVAFLASPWVGLTLEAITQYGADRGLDYRSADPQTEPGKWLAIMNGWFKSWWALHPEEMLLQVLEATQLRGSLAQRDDVAALANLDKLSFLSHHLGHAWGIDRFTEWLEGKVREGANEEEGLLVDDLEAVHFSTVHRAKGLEWPFVVVTNWSKSAARHGPVMEGGGKPAMKVSGLMSSDWEERIYQDGLRDAAEQERLLYVALTRARDYLAVIDAWPTNQDDPFEFFTLSDHRIGTVADDFVEKNEEAQETLSAWVPREDGGPVTGRSWHPNRQEKSLGDQIWHWLQSDTDNLAGLSRAGRTFWESVKSRTWARGVIVSGPWGITEADFVTETNGQFDVIRMVDPTGNRKAIWPDYIILKEGLAPRRYWSWDGIVPRLHDPSSMS